MNASIALVDGPAEQVDRSALLLMLSYIEAECRRIGATAAADHAALAASLVPGQDRVVAVPHATAAPMRRKRANSRLH